MAAAEKVGDGAVERSPCACDGGAQLVAPSEKASDGGEDGGDVRRNVMAAMMSVMLAHMVSEVMVDPILEEMAVCDVTVATMTVVDAKGTD